MAKPRAVQTLSWIALLLAPFVSVFIIGAATGTSPFALDAWKTFLNDEHNYYWSVSQMHLFGEPSGITGYNEQAAPRPSYGSYGIFVYIPYYLAAFFTDLGSHNFMYAINMGFGVAVILLILLVLRPDARQSLCLAILILFQFIINRYLCSGMSEGSYVLFAGIMVVCSLYVVKMGADGRPLRVMLALTVMVLASAFWGCMRPFLLAFLLMPCILALTSTSKLGKPWRAAVLVLAVVAAAASLSLYVYYAQYYVVPYFDSDTIATSMGSRILAALPGLAAKHVECVLYCASKLLSFKWLSVMTFTFALCWFILLFMGAAAFRRRDRMTAGLLIALVVAGLAIFEAHLLLYNYKQMHRMLIPVDIIYLVTILWFGLGKRTASGPTRRRAGASGRHAEAAPSGFARVAAMVSVVAVCLLCCGSLAVRTNEFDLPQKDETLAAIDEKALRAELSRLMPESADQWDNTIAHPIENDGLWLYFEMPRYLSPTTCKDNYLEETLSSDAFKSLYVSLPEDNSLNAKMAAQYQVIYRGQGHIIYKTR